MKIKSDFGILKVKSGCEKLKKMTKKDAVPVTIHAFVIAPTDDHDGVGHHFALQICDVIVENEPPPIPKTLNHLGQVISYETGEIGH